VNGSQIVLSGAVELVGLKEAGIVLLLLGPELAASHKPYHMAFTFRAQGN
jgi:hypothetical protein